jgi:hypothetical protein
MNKINHGQALALMRKKSLKNCTVCGVQFEGLERKTVCEHCRNNAKAKAYHDRKTAKATGSLVADDPI